MAGMDFMIRLFLIMISLSGCGNLPIAYVQNFSEVNNVIFGFPDYEITNDIFESYDSSFMKIRFGRGPHAILILAYIENDVYEWVGSDDVRIFTLNGRIIRTIGLPHNFELQNYSNEVFSASNLSYELVNLYNPDVFSVKMERSILSKDSTIKKLGDTVAVNRITENFKIESIGWNGKNYYFQNKDTMQIERLEQDIHPRLPTLKVEYYLKY
jgi:hypothetical protein